MRVALLAVLWALATAARAGGTLELCFNYGCAERVEVAMEAGRLDGALAPLAAARNAAEEREALARAVGRVYRIAGEQSPIAADRAGNFLDWGAEGRMDCIDHSTDTTRILALIAARGGLRFHRVLEPARRTSLFTQHFSAVIEEIAPVPAPRAEPAEAEVPDHVPVLLALCDCGEVVEDVPRPPEGEAPPPGSPGARFAVDSWFVEHGEPAVVLPLAEWMNGEGPNVQ